MFWPAVITVLHHSEGLPRHEGRHDQLPNGKHGLWHMLQNQPDRLHPQLELARHAERLI